MAYREDLVDIDLGTGKMHRSFINRSIGEGDIYGDLFGVRVFYNGTEPNLMGVTCTGLFIRSDGVTVTVYGERVGNICYVILPQSCYAVEGDFQLSMKLTGGGSTVTARIVDGTVVNTEIGDLVDPGDVIPDLASWTALVSRAEAAAQKLESFDITATLIEGTRYRLGVVEVSS